MRKIYSKTFGIALVAVSLLSACHQPGTSSKDASQSGTASSSYSYVPEDPYDERSFLKAEVGYHFQLPSWLTDVGASFHVYDPDGKEISADEEGYLLSKRGEGHVAYKESGADKTLPLEIVDTEKPMFLPLWTAYSHVTTYSYFIYNAVVTDLNSIFVAHDNSGEAVTTSFYLLFEDSDVVTLTDGSVFTPHYNATGKSGYYTCYARAVDTSGNAVVMSQRLDVSESAASLQATYGKADTVLMNDTATPDKIFTVASSESVGTAVKVDFDILVFLDSSDHAYSRLLINDTLVFGYNGSTDSMNGNAIPKLTWKHYSITNRIVAEGFNPYSDRSSSVCGLGVNFVSMDMSSNDIYLLKNVTVSVI